MKHIIGLMVSGAVCFCGFAQEQTAAEGVELKRWSREKANEWYAGQPWLVGCNFIPSTAINQLEMWQADTFDPATIDKELKWAAGLGFNTVRVYLHDLAWEADAAGLKKRMDQFLDLAGKHHIKPMFVLFDDCWNAHPRIGKQPDPQPGVHNSGWLQSPGRDVVNNPESWPRLEKYLKDIVGTFAKDKRVLLWDLYNEPGNEGQGNKSLPLLKKAFQWAREVNPTQPLSAGVWTGFQDFNEFQEAASDVITFHNYNDAGNLARQIAGLKKHGRPVICTEWLRRGNSDVAACLPVFLKAKVGCYNWGLVAGKTQTIYPWGSPKGAPEPKVWFHDLLRKDGTPFNAEEAALFSRLTGRGSETGKTSRLRLQVLKTLPKPVIHKDSPGAENIPGGFEGGSSVKVTMDGKSEYHLFSTVYPKLDWSQAKLDHWVSGDGVNFQHAGVVLENYRDEKAGMNHIFCSPIPYYDEKSARWYLFYCEFVSAASWVSESGIMWCAPSKTAGMKGVNGPYDFPGRKTFVDGRYIPKEFVPVANSGPYQVKDGRWATLICPHVLGETTRKVMLGEGHSALATKVNVDGSDHVKWVGGWPIAVGFAATPLGPFTVDELLLPPMIDPTGFTENPMPMKVRGPKTGREYWVAVFDFLAPESTPFTPKNVFGFAWSEDGVHWPKENGQLINVDDGLAPGEQGWWRGAWAVRTPHQMLDEGDGTYTVFFTGGSTDKFFDGFRAVGALKVMLVEE